MGNKGGTAVVATHEKKGLENKPTEKYGTLQQDSKADNTDKGNPPNETIKKLSAAEVIQQAGEAAGEAATKVLEENGMIPKAEGAEAAPQTAGQPVTSATKVQGQDEIVKSEQEILEGLMKSVNQLLEPFGLTFEKLVEMKEKLQEVSSVQASIKPKFDPKTGQWVVAHSKLKEPMTFSSKVEAEKVALTLRANDVPEVSYDPETKTFDIDHPDWEETVSVQTPEEAKTVIASKLVALGAEENEAKTDADTAVQEATPKTEEKAGETPAETPATTPAPDGTVVASSVTVQADVKQTQKGTPDKELVSGMPGTAVEKKSGEKGLFPDIPGRVVEVDPGKAAPAGGAQNGYGSLKTQHGGDYSSLAKQSQAEVSKMRSAHGLRSEMVKLFSSEEGLTVARHILALASVMPLNAVAEGIANIEVKADGVEPEAARKYISDVISEETAEDKSAKPQAIAMAYSKARQKTSEESLGWTIPAAPGS